MLVWTFIFLIISIIAAIFGFTGVAVASAGIAQVLFYIFLGLFFISLILSLSKRSDESLNKHI